LVTLIQRVSTVLNQCLPFAFILPFSFSVLPNFRVLTPNK
jgi:hypothetical protein